MCLNITLIYSQYKSRAPDNLMCEDFSTIKNEFFYSKNEKMQHEINSFMNLINILFSLKLNVLKGR